MIQENRKYYDIIILILCVSVGSVLMFALNNFGEPIVDEEFQTICVRRYNEAPLGLLVFWIGHLWTDIFGFTILNLRNLTSIEYVLTMGITTIYLYRHTGNIRLSAIIFLLGCVLLRLGAFFIYNWDSGSFLFDAIALCLLMSIISKPTTVKAVLFGFAIGLITLGRTPSVIFLPAAIIIVSRSLKDNKGIAAKTRMPLLIIAGWLIAMLVFTSIILGSPWKYISLFAEGNVVSGHNPIKDIHQLWGRTAQVVLMAPYVWFYGFVSVLIAILLPRIKHKLRAIFIMAVWISYCLLIAYNWSDSIPRVNMYLGMDSPIGVSLLLALPIYNLFGGHIKANKKSVLKLWSCGLLVVSIAFGSDAFNERLVTAFAIPVIVSVLWKLHAAKIKTFIKTLVLVATITFTSILCMHLIALKTMYPDWMRTDIPVLRGLKMDKKIQRNLEDIYISIIKARKEGIPYVFVGNNLLSELLGGADEGISFQNFHARFYSDDDLEEYKKNIIPFVDEVIYLENPSPLYQILPGVLREEGFTDSIRVNDITIFYRKPRRNFNKIYEIIK